MAQLRSNCTLRTGRSFRLCFFVCLFFHFFASKSEVAQSCLTLCNPRDCSLPGSSVHGIFWARVLPSPGDLPDPGIKPRSPTLQADALPSEPPGNQDRLLFIGQRMEKGSSSFKGIFSQKEGGDLRKRADFQGSHKLCFLNVNVHVFKGLKGRP